MSTVLKQRCKSNVFYYLFTRSLRTLFRLFSKLLVVKQLLFLQPGVFEFNLIHFDRYKELISVAKVKAAMKVVPCYLVVLNNYVDVTFVDIKMVQRESQAVLL